MPKKKIKAKARTKVFYSATIVGPDHKVTQINMIARPHKGAKPDWIISLFENGREKLNETFGNPKTAGCLFTDKIDDFLRNNVHR